MKIIFKLLVAMVTVIGISTGNLFSDEPKGKVVYASNQFQNTGELGNNSASGLEGNTENFKAKLAYEMAYITAAIVSAPTTNVENFKVEFAYAIAQVTAKVIPIIPSGCRNEFAYEMARITARIVSDPKVDIQKAKAEFAYEIAQITTKIITNADKIVTGNGGTMLKVYNDYTEPKSAIKVDNTGAVPKATLLRKNDDIERKATVKANKINSGNASKAIVNSGDIDLETYTKLIDEMMNVGERNKHSNNKVNIDGEIRYHYALNSGSEGRDRDSSGIRTYLGAETKINKDWRVYGMLEGQKNFLNYNNEFKLSRLYVAGKVGTSMVRAGSFGYLMAEGNIYDSGFKGVRFDFGETIKYTLSHGKTNYTKETSITTARYTDFDYNLEAGVYHYRMDDSAHKQNTIWTLGGNYNFSNFGVGAMVLGSSLKDRKGDCNGYVLSLNYGDLKTYKQGTYDIFAKYYNQPMDTYIAHGMNGAGDSMQGFKGYGLGIHYTFEKDLVGGIEYYNLTDRISGEKGTTLWSQLTWYF